MTAIKRFAKTAGTFFVGSVLSKLVAVLLLPIYTAYLLPSEYGMYDVTISVLNFVMPVVFLQIWDGMYRFVFDCDSDAAKSKVVVNSLVVCFFGAGVFTVLYLAAVPFFGDLLSPAMWGYGLTLSLQYEASYIARSYFRNALFATSGVVNALFAAILNICLICFCDWGIESIYLSAALGNAVQIALICFVMKLPSKISFALVDRKLIIRMIAFSVPLCLSALGFWLFNGFTKVAITYLLGAGDNGLYAVVTRFTAAATMMASVFQFAWNEASYLMAKNDQRAAVYGSVSRLLLWLLLAVAAVFPYAVKLVFPFFVADAYAAAVSLLPAATAGVMANAYANFLGAISATEKMTKPVLASTMLGAVVNVVATPLAITGLGLAGGVWALAASYATMAAARYMALRKCLGISLGARLVAPVAALSIAFILFGTPCTTLQAGAVLVCVLICLGLAVVEIKQARFFRKGGDARWV